jgi:hypothetical protein
MEQPIDDSSTATIQSASTLKISSFTKDDLEKHREAFKGYIKRTRNALLLGTPLASIAKAFTSKKKTKEPESFLGVKHATPEDIIFLKKYFAKSDNSKKSRKEAIAKLGSEYDLAHISEIAKIAENTAPKEIEDTMILILHRQVVQYVKQPAETDKKTLRDKVSKNEISEDDYFKATTMCLFGSYLLDLKIPKKS